MTTVYQAETCEGGGHVSQPYHDITSAQASQSVQPHLAQKEVDPWPLVHVIHDAPAVEHDLDDPDFQARGTKSTRIAADARHCTVASRDAHAARRMDKGFVEIEHQ